MTVRVEVAVDTIESARAAEAGGAARIELCAGLVEGGTTPSAGMIAVCREELGIPVTVLIRPRSGDFVYTGEELDVMRRNIAFARDMGVDSVALGALLPDGTVDVERTRALVADANPLSVTFHRAFDFTRDAEEALEAIIRAGVSRVLTSGRSSTAHDGVGTLSQLVRQAGERITVVAAGGITEDNVGRLVQATRVREVHVRAAERLDSVMSYRRADISLSKRLVGEYAHLETDSDRVARVVEAVASVET